jgi:MFS family permease
MQAHEQAHERELASFVSTNLARNYRANLFYGMLGQTGFRLLYAPTFIPAYLHQMTGSDALVGSGAALLQLGMVFSPIFSASRLEREPTILPYAMRTGTAMRAVILGLAVSGWFTRGWVQLALTLGCLFLLGLFTGAQRIAFQLLMAKVIPIDRRGRLQAWRNFSGGAIAAALSYFAGKWLIEQHVWGNGYATTFFLTFLLTSAGLIILTRMLREPHTPVPKLPTRLGDRLRQFPRLLADTDYRHFLAAQTFCVLARIASPFFILYAGQRMGMTGQTIGLLAFCYLGADTLANLVWGYMGDHTGYRATLIGSILLWIGSIVLLMAVAAPWAFYLCFCGLGAASAGYLMSQQTMVLEFGSRHEAPMRLGLSTTLEGAVAAIGPLLGGVIAALAGYVPLFGTALACLCISLIILLFGVREPRLRRAEFLARTQAVLD